MSKTGQRVVDVVDAMHYESRALRGELTRSNMRTASARSKVPSDLKPGKQQALLRQDWQPPEMCHDINSENTPVSDNPAFTEMRVALQEYETSTHYSSPTKHRAFFSALRTLLSEIVTEHNSSEQAIKLSAAYKWFSKHKPHTTDDPALAAALAASLSISAAEGPQRQARPSDDINKARAFTTQGTKHEFFSPYSAAPTQQQQQQQQPHRVTGPGAARAAAAPPPPALPRPTPKLRPDIVLAPSVRSGGPRQESTHPPQGSLSSLGPVLAPKGRKARAVFDPDNLEAPAGQHPNTQGKAPSWFQGPFRTGQPHNTSAPPTRKEEEEEIAALRAKWARMEDSAARGIVHAERQVAEWSQQRARLEEEIVRRQEASRFAAPSLRATALPHPGAGNLGADYISAYAGITVDAVHSLAAGVDDVVNAPEAIQLTAGLVPPVTTMAAAESVRAAAPYEYERDVYKIGVRMQQLGIVGCVRPEAMQHALEPVPDKPYLECLAKLPRPGSNLESRPGSVKEARKKSAKKKGTEKKK